MNTSAPMALLKVVGALTPLMGNAEIGAAMVAEIQAIFVAMNRAAAALERIDARDQQFLDHLTGIHLMLNSINEKLQKDMPLSTVETTLLLEHLNGEAKDG